MAVDNPPARGHPPETSPASASSERPVRPSSHAAAVTTSTTTPELPSPRNFRSQSLAHHDRSPRVATTAPIKRKPLSASASPLARRFSQSSQYSQPSQYAPSPPPQHYLDILDELPSPPLMLDQLANRTSRSYSIDSPTVYDFPSAKVAPLMPLVPEGGLIDKFPDVPAAGPEIGPQDWDDAQSELGRNIPDVNPAALQTQNDPTSAFQIQGFIPNEQDFDVIPIRTASQLHQDSEQVDVDPALHSKQLGDQASNINTTQPNRMSLFSRKPSPPHLKLANTKDIHQQNSIAFDSTAAVITDQPSELVPLALAPAPAPVAAATDNATINKQDPTTRASVIALSNQTSDNLNANKPLPPLKSPASSRLGSFFGWTTSSPASTSFSDKGFSPLPSPFSQRTTTVYTDDTPASAKTEPLTAKAHAGLSNQTTPLEYCEDYLQTPPTTTTPSPASQIEDMEDELKAISAELAASIRREMDLEDLVERLQSQVGGRGEPGKRTSDYFSDSGYSSAKASEADASREEVAQVQRRAEQEKAQVRLELSQKLNDERSRRRELDLQIKELSLRASKMGEEQAQRGSMSDTDSADRVKELESSCEELRRRLSEEREVKDNFQDLLDALKGELQSAANERDNLRDEVVPQLRARVEGLEQQAAEYSKSTYESTKIQQELQTLQEENASLRALKQNRESQRMEGNQTRMSRIARSSSVSTVNSTFKLQQAPLGRSNTVKGPQGQQFESREAMSERLKDVEAQRDALHSALKNLLERQEFQNRENEKKIRVLEQERTRLLATSPKKAGYERDVSNLKEEIAVLRKRAEEAVEQKWQVEKGLAGLKMDLDRAEEEIAGLKSLLRENDILIPAAFFTRPMSSPDSVQGDATPVTSASLQKAYQDLRDSYGQALQRIKKLELSSVETDALDKLEAAVAADGSQPSQASFEAQVKEYLETERDLADQLQASARRVEELAAQVQAQLATNATLRTRLTDAVTRGEANQQTSKERITGLQRRLKDLEDELSSTQSAAEDRVARHEEEIKQLREANNGQIQRLRDAAGGLKSPLPKSPGLRSPTQRLFPPRSPLSPLFANGARSPRFANSPISRPGSSGPNSARSLKSPGTAGEEDQAAQVEKLRRRVAELEKALNETDAEMQEVVGRMNGAQIEVLQLQEEREQAIRETRRLQRQIDEERVKVFEDRFRDLSASAMA
ncbi:hypothetical protein PspLS_07490 [Pyricularia sp. CBS 133598]|nr:hypothetical protein PspLS_07490 [Pyricularia sp. CBS 133598]